MSDTIKLYCKTCGGELEAVPGTAIPYCPKCKPIVGCQKVSLKEGFLRICGPFRTRLRRSPSGAAKETK